MNKTEKARQFEAARQAALPDAVKAAMATWPEYGRGYNHSLERRTQCMAAVHRIAAAWGGLCLDNEYTRAKDKLRCRCAHGHEFESLAESIQRGYWCRTCYDDRRRFTMEDMHALARKHNGLCLSDTYVGSQSHLQWQCEKGHIWLAKPNKVQLGHWCNACNLERRRIKAAELQAIAQARGGECLSEDPIFSRVNVRWRCARGHEWAALAGTVRRGSWCPQCAILARIHKKGSKARRKYEASDRHQVDGAELLAQKPETQA
ncbi:hypothetical protein HNQ50_001346 [Silvimonas terrae]|uniref:Zinc-ribbon domain-containing protein n=1 Tax=Silvimonas terrae TaxID=300266 RepID=A0A840RDG1_9NEIS|nr:hypothetical protein [Silvimonas terrae]MBB5190624.1 hypothetical protein [Silvimonas terrae]